MPGLLRDAKELDAQAGFETGMVGAMTALSADLIDAMQLDADLLVDFADPVFCNDCMAALQRLARPLVVDKVTLAFEALKEVGHGGTFLSHDHTFEHFRRELWMPSLLERRNWELWEMDGGLDIFKAAEKKTLAMLNRKPPALLSEEACRKIDAVVAEAQNLG